MPNAETLFPRAVAAPGEERIIVLQRGPDGRQPNEDYNGNGNDDDACFPGNKADDAARPPAGTRC